MAELSFVMLCLLLPPVFILCHPHTTAHHSSTDPDVQRGFAGSIFQGKSEVPLALKGGRPVQACGCAISLSHLLLFRYNSKLMRVIIACISHKRLGRNQEGPAKQSNDRNRLFKSLLAGAGHVGFGPLVSGESPVCNGSDVGLACTLLARVSNVLCHSWVSNEPSSFKNPVGLLPAA